MNWLTKILVTLLIIVAMTVARIGLLAMGSSPDFADAILGSFLILWFVAILIDTGR